MEARLFDGDTPHVSTFEFHEHRERAPHLEQPVHRGRLDAAAGAVLRACVGIDWPVVVDLGCGDGGLLSLLPEHITATGFDFQPSNQAGWADRAVIAYGWNFVEQWDEIPQADVYVMTEVLEHLNDPHEMVRRVRRRNAQLVASSPWTETYESHDECHAWAWDMEGYANMIRTAGFKIVEHVTTGMFQVMWARCD